MKTTLDLESIINPDSLAGAITSKWNEWDGYRRTWKEEKKELRNYLYATDTSTTTNKRLPWANSTTTPKLTQIYDNLKANYTAALFPRDKWFTWVANDEDGATKEKRDAIQAYMHNKMNLGNFRSTVARLIDDYIQTGNCFATVEYVAEKTTLPEGDSAQGFVGPKLVRLSPYDIVFDPTAASFKDAPKILRNVTTVGQASKMLPEETFQRIMDNRQAVGRSDQVAKSEGFVADGFSSIENYYSSSFVEFITFYGDLYDVDSQEFHENRVITIVDRAYIVSNEPNPSWLGSDNIFHSGWRTRPDNLYAMGPLDNLVGMQYRIDHLENLRADVFDMIAAPVIKIKGDVEDFVYEPAARIIMGEEGDVAFMHPDATALQADFQIRELENKMEELAGAPKQAMGLRTPGEKTAFEVDTLHNAANRIFQHKTAQFEIEFLEPIMLAMLESARRNMLHGDTVSITDPDYGVQLFMPITKEDITAKGKLVPMGSRYFAEQARRVQSLTQLIQIKSDPTIAPHLSGKVIARLLSEELGEEELFGENVAVQEQLETQKAATDAEASYEEDLMVKAEQGL